MNICIEDIELKIINILNGRKYIEVLELKEYFKKIEIIYIFVNLYNFQKISFCEIDTKKFVDMGEYYVPYLKIYKIG